MDSYCFSVITSNRIEPLSGRRFFRRDLCFATESAPLHTRAYTEYWTMWYPS